MLGTMEVWISIHCLVILGKIWKCNISSLQNLVPHFCFFKNFPHNFLGGYLCTVSPQSYWFFSIYWHVIFGFREIYERGAKYLPEVFCRIISLPPYDAKTKGWCCFRECQCKGNIIFPEFRSFSSFLDLTCYSFSERWFLGPRKYKKSWVVHLEGSGTKLVVKLKILMLAVSFVVYLI